jgi:hypothetical protein
MTTREQNVEQVVAAVRELVQALTDHRAGGIGTGPTLVTAQQNLRDALRAALDVKIEERADG